jgi:hypothetical protein
MGRFIPLFITMLPNKESHHLYLIHVCDIQRNKGNTQCLVTR